jgi:hypothetical protein
MRRGCISLGNIKCDECHRTILYPERYLSLEEGRGQNKTLCMECCQEKGLVKSESAGKEEETLFNLSSD